MAMQPSWSLSLLIVYCRLLCAMGADALQLHPKFPAADQMDYFTGSDAREALEADWLPYRQTVLYMIQRKNSRDKDVSRKAVIDIANLQKGEIFSMKIKVKCSLQSRESVTEFSYPFEDAIDKEMRLCTLNNQYRDSVLPLTIKMLSAIWTSESAYKVVFEIYMHDDTWVHFSETLNFYSRIKFQFIGQRWRLESNGLYLRNWDGLYNFKGDKLTLNNNGAWKPNGYWLTQDGLSVMMGPAKDYSWIIEKQFIHPDVVSRIRDASEFVQASIGLGALVLSRYPDCGRYVDGDAVFGAASLDMLAGTYPQVQRLDVLTGNITFSPDGVADMMLQPHKHRSTWSTLEDTHICRQLTLRKEFRNAIGEYNGPPYNSLPERLEIKSSTKLWIDYSRHSNEDCYALPPGDRTVTLFVRDADSFLICPIICVRLSTQYEFDKEGMRLYPISHGPDRHKSAFTAVQGTGISISSDSIIVKFENTATDKDEGMYSCKAGNVKVAITVNLVSLPVFKILKANWTDGSLPDSIYAPIGGSYTAKCTAYFLGMKSVTVTPEFYVVVDRTNGTWTKLSFEEFEKRLKFHDASTKLKVTQTSHSVSLALTVKGIPKLTNHFDFSHRYVCRATVSDSDIKRYGVTEYSVQTGTDVVLIEPVTSKDIKPSMSPCCVDRCFGENCEFIYLIKPTILEDLKKYGIDTSGTFTNGGSALDDALQSRITYHKDNGTLIYKSGHGILEMSDSEKDIVRNLRPVFNLHKNSENGGANVEISSTSSDSLPIGFNLNLFDSKATHLSSNLPSLIQPTQPANSSMTELDAPKTSNSTVRDLVAIKNSLIEHMLKATGGSNAVVSSSAIQIFCLGFVALYKPI